MCLINKHTYLSICCSLSLFSISAVFNRHVLRNWQRGCSPLTILPLPFSSPRSFPFSSPPLEVGPLKPARWSGERCKLPTPGSGRWKRIRCALKLPESHSWKSLSVFWSGCFFTKLDLGWRGDGVLWDADGVFWHPHHRRCVYALVFDVAVI